MPNIFPILDINQDYLLRELNVDDSNAFLEYFANPKVARFILSDIPTNDLEAKNELLYWIQLFAQNKGIYWAIANKKNNKIIGTIGLHEWDRHNNRAEISYDLSYEYWGLGIMSKALYSCLKYIFKELRINRIQAVTIKENINSIKFLENNHFTFEGILQKYRFYNERYYDINIYSMLRRNFEIINNL